MSHFTLTVILTAARLKQHKGVLDKALAEILAPFEESPEEKTFLKFKDEEDEYRKDWETKKTKMVRGPDGKLLSSYNEKFRVPVTRENPFPNPQYVVPKEYKEVEVLFKEAYPLFGTFCEEYHSSKIDPETRRFGYWHNPNAKWDWYGIGGRWTGYYPLKKGVRRRLGRPGAFGNSPTPGRGDIVRVQDINMTAVANLTEERAKEFFKGYQAWLENPSNGYNPARSRALDLGIVHVMDKTVKAGEGEIAIPWALSVDPDDNRHAWTDIAKIIDHDTFMKEYLERFNPLATYAALDDEGWHAPGKMGWWGCSSDTPEDSKAFKESFIDLFIKPRAEDDLLVLVDCHI